jgi:acetyl esterase
MSKKRMKDKMCTDYNNQSRGSHMYPLYTQGNLDLQTEAFLKQIAEAKCIPLTSITPQQARESFLEASWVGKSNNGIRMRDLDISSSASQISIRIYTPEGNHLFPILIFFHGGGFVLGSLNEFDSFCTFLAGGASCLVVSVGYRLAPENKHPAAVEDVWTAIKWIAANAKDIHGDSNRIAVAGDSAGANLAAVSSLIARDYGLPGLIYQVLICPWVDLSSCDRDSYRYFGEGIWLSTQNVHWYRQHYLQNLEQAATPMVSPLLAEDLSGVPPALVITAEFDVLRDEGELYAKRLQEEGISVQYTRYQGMLHDFVILPGLFDRAKEAIDEICLALKNAFC